MKSLIVCLFAGIAWSVAQDLTAGPPDGGQGGPGGGPQSRGSQGDDGGKPRAFGGPGGQVAPGGGGPGGHGGGRQGGPGGPGGGSGAQDGPGGPGGRGGGESMLQQLMAMDSNSDGALTPAEVTDTRLQMMLQPADTDANGVVTFAELKSAMENNAGQGGPGGHPRPGEILPGIVQDQLQLSRTQRQQLAALQAQVDTQLAQILNPQQLQLLAAGPQQPPMGGGGPGTPGTGLARNGSANNGQGKGPPTNNGSGSTPRAGRNSKR